jgi:hypothetical protein
LRSIKGEPISQFFDYKRKVYSLIFRDDREGDLTIFVPEFQYPRGYRVEFLNGDWKMNAEDQTLYLKYQAVGDHRVLRILPL